MTTVDVGIGLGTGAIIAEDVAPADPYYSDDDLISINRLPPAYANYMGIDPEDGVYKLLTYEHTLSFIIPIQYKVTDPTEPVEILIEMPNGSMQSVPIGHWIIDSITVGPNEFFNYDITYDLEHGAGTIPRPSHAAFVNITESISPFTTDTAAWYCLMSDLTYDTFSSDLLVLEQTTPSYRALVSLTLTEPFTFSDGDVMTHTFVVNATPYGFLHDTFGVVIDDTPIAGEQESITPSAVVGTVVYETISLVDKVRNLAAAGV